MVDSNDLQEAGLAKLYPKLNDLSIACFCRMGEYYPMWKIYSEKGREENPKDEDWLGVMIKFVFKDGYGEKDLFADPEIDGRPITYLPIRKFNSLLKGKPVDENDSKPMGFLKSRYWAYEKEFRFASFGDIGERHINGDAIEKIEVFNAPNSGIDGTALRKRFGGVLDDGLKEKVHFHKSALSDVVKKRNAGNNAKSGGKMPNDSAKMAGKK